MCEVFPELDDFVKEYKEILRYEYNGDEDSTSVPLLLL